MSIEYISAKESMERQVVGLAYRGGGSGRSC